MKANLGMPYSSFMIAFAYFVVFNLFGLSSSVLALTLGLNESNFALIYLSSAVGITLLSAVFFVKLVFFVCMGGLILEALDEKRSS